MALVTCPSCGNSISDKAKVCPNCNYQITEDVSMENFDPKICEDCGAELSADDTVCSKCGCPVKQNEEIIPQKVEITSVNLPKAKKSAKKVIIILSIVIALIVTGIGAFFVIKGEQDKIASSNYFENLELATITMLDGASKAESTCNLIKSVWYNTIYEEYDVTTDKYTCSNGFGFNSDFNDSINALFSDSGFIVDIEYIKSNQDKVAKLMKELQNPPDEYEEAYEALKEFYDAYLDLTGLAVNPSGSLQSYSSDFHDADTETLNCYKAMQIYVE